MKLCIFSDIHGNGPAFEVAYPLILQESADLNIFLGDLCGYYFDEEEVFEKIRKIPRLVSVRGNHDDIFVRASKKRFDYQQAYAQKYGKSLNLFLDKDRKEMICWMEGLPLYFEDAQHKFFCCHGSPLNFLEEYIYPDTPLSTYEKEGFDTFFLGHTHYSMNRYFRDSVFLNPGSIGQPRGGQCPSYLVWDLDFRVPQFKYFSYDSRRLLSRIKEIGDSTAYLQDIILRSE